MKRIKRLTEKQLDEQWEVERYFIRKKLYGETDKPTDGLDNERIIKALDGAI